MSKICLSQIAIYLSHFIFILCGTQRSQLGITTDKDPSWDMWRHTQHRTTSSDQTSQASASTTWSDQIYHSHESQVNMIKHASMFQHFVALLYWHDFNFLAPKHSAATVSYASYACTFCFSLPTLDLTKRRQKGSKSGIDINFTMKSHVRPQHDSWNEIILEAKGTSHPPSGVANACHVFFTHTHTNAVLTCTSLECKSKCSL